MIKKNISNWNGIICIMFGIIIILIKSFLPVYIDSFGILHENFYLLPVGYIFLICGIMILIKKIIQKKIVR